MNWSVINFVGVDGDVEDARPALEGHGDEEGEHGLGHVVKVELVLLPNSLVTSHLIWGAFLGHQVFSLAVILILKENSCHVNVMLCYAMSCMLNA